MKTTPIRFLLPVLAAVVLLGTAPESHAYPHHDGPAHYRHDRHGYWDAHGHRHPYVYRNGHHGYWWNHIWIIVD